MVMVCFPTCGSIYVDIYQVVSLIIYTEHMKVDKRCICDLQYIKMAKKEYEAKGGGGKKPYWTNHSIKINEKQKAQ